jgi:putative Holliday junction resolvase
VVESLAELASAESIGVFVVGLPRNLRGHEASPARRARKFAERLARRTGCRVELFDERFTTQEASRRLAEQGLDARRQRARIDSAAAAVLLQTWLDAGSGAR